MRTAHRLGLFATALAVLAAVFAAWMSPHLVVELAAFVAACF
jgi:hypothetical protein